jgi:hypothetical protein
LVSHFPDDLQLALLVLPAVGQAVRRPLLIAARLATPLR